MKKIAIGLGIVIAVALVAALAAPSFIDWTRYRGAIAERMSAVTGREVRIQGAIAFRILPEPRLELGDVSVSNLPGGGAPDMVQMKSLTVRVALLPLLGGRIAVQSIALIKPVVRLEVLADGSENWILHPRPGVAGRMAAPSRVAGLAAVRLDSVSVRDGTLIYSEGPDKPPLRLEKIEAGLQAKTLAGPYRLRGSLVASGVPLAFHVDLGRWTADHQAPVLAHFDLVKSKAHLTLDGVVFGAFGTEHFNGAVKAEGENLASALETVSGIRAPRLDLPFKLDFQATGDRHQLALNDIGFQFGGNALSGAATIGFLPSGPRVDATLAIGYLNLDSFLARTGSLGKTKIKTQQAPADGGGSPTAKASFPYRIPTGFSGSLDLGISVASFHGGIVRDMRIAGSLQDGQLTISRLGALLPGASTISLTGAGAEAAGGPQFSGQLTIASADVRALLDWLGMDTHEVPPGRLTILSARIPFSATREGLTANHLEVLLDQSHMSGNATLSLGGRPALTLDLAVDRIDLDDYLPNSAGHSPAAIEAGVGGNGARVGGQGILASPNLRAGLNAVDTDLKLRVGEVVYRVVPITGLSLDLALKDGGLDLTALRIANAGGASLIASGSARDLVHDLSYQGTVSLQAPGLGVFARLGGFAPPPSWMMLHGLKVTANVTGDKKGVTLNGLDVALGPEEATGDVELRYAKPRLEIRANLTASNLWLDPFLGGGAPSIAPASAPSSGDEGGPPSGAAVAAKSLWSERPLNLAPLTWVDGVAALKAKQITAKGYRVRNAEITATFGNSGVTLNPIRGLIFGGALAAKAQLVGGANPSVDASFVWQDVDLHRVLFEFTGLGTLTGQGTLRGNLSSQGATADALIRNLAGEVGVSAEKGAFRGLDVARLSRGLENLKSDKDLIALSKAATNGGVTPFTEARGSWSIAKGIARTADTMVTFPDATATVRGWLDLPSWAMALTSAIHLTAYTKAPPLGVVLSGSIQNPRRHLDTAALARYIAATAAARPPRKEGRANDFNGTSKDRSAGAAVSQTPATVAPNGSQLKASKSKMPIAQTTRSEPVSAQPSAPLAPGNAGREVKH